MVPGGAERHAHRRALQERLPHQGKISDTGHPGRHSIQFHFFQNECWRMTVTDNGIPPVGPIREGGGITEMRRRIQRLGGTMELYTVPRFSIQIFVPKEEVQR